MILNIMFAYSSLKSKNLIEHFLYSLELRIGKLIINQIPSFSLSIQCLYLYLIHSFINSLDRYILSTNCVPHTVAVMGSSSELEQSLPSWNSLTGGWSGKKEINVQVNDIL